MSEPDPHLRLGGPGRGGGAWRPCAGRMRRYGRFHSIARVLLVAILGILPYARGEGNAGEKTRRPAEDIRPSSGAATTGTAARQVRTPVPSIPLERAPPGVPKSLSDLQRAAGKDYLCVQRGNFLVAGDLGLLDYEYLVDGVLDYCSEALIRAFFDKGPVRDKTVNIFVFKDYDSYEGGLRRFLGMNPISPYGHYGHSQKYIVINYETGPGTLVHELTHALMSEDFPEAPIWLAEGMASLYEHCRAESDVLKGDDNWRLPELKAALEKDLLMPLPALLAMTPASFRGNRESLNYAQSRYFCKYLEELGILTTIYKDFRERYQQDPTGAATLIKAFGKPLEVVDTAWRRWITYQYWRE